MEEKVFFNRILQLRTENNLSQAELSEYLGITRSALSHYELGHRNLTMTSLKK
ncbi:helix-turn-helix transcriptional regulator [[Clostridium] innocuum]|nr:helix-turn-helix transcriptional regulator [[Clostridium] innocuum]